jgi:hypothetical protein
MELTVLVVPECPHTAPLRERLTLALAGREDITVTWREVTDPDEAEHLGMHGSPTLLVDGTDPFTAPGQPPSLSCRLAAPPSLAQLRQAISRPSRP